LPILSLLLSLLFLPKAEAATLTRDDFIQAALLVAAEDKLPAKLFVDTIECESNFNPSAVSPTGDYGIAQYNLKAQGMTKEEALDPLGSLQRMGDDWKAGHQRWWVCYRKLTQS